MKRSYAAFFGFFALLWLLVSVVFSHPVFAQSVASGWQLQDIPFRSLAITSVGSSFWTCGLDESIATSLDGKHWQVKHSKPNGAVLLAISFANDKFGYAAGSGGIYLTTEDGGETWSSHTTRNESIFQISFADSQHGLIRTRTLLLFTRDGGANWLKVSAGQNEAQAKQFPYTQTLKALDRNHMGIFVKEGPAQYFAQAFLVTQDSGETWKFSTIPNTTLYSFLVVDGKYWAIGTEVIHKDDPGGGYAVPVALFSLDGEKWTHSGVDLSSCKPRMCVACTSRGCLSANGTITDVFSSRTTYKTFPPSTDLTASWAATDSLMCSVGESLECATLETALKPLANAGPLPVALATGQSGYAEKLHCLSCEMGALFDPTVQGSFSIKVALQVGKNGAVTDAKVEGAPTANVQSQIEQHVRDWIFEPNEKPGKVTATFSVGIIPQK